MTWFKKFPALFIAVFAFRYSTKIYVIAPAAASTAIMQPITTSIL